MISEMGKLFVGGLSWDTDEKRLREYFESYGEVVEAMIMKDRTTGRARGFGFVAFADQGVAERVVKGKHCIDGRMVEAKKAVPRDEYITVGRCGGSSGVSPTQCGGTKKIFVGGLPPTVRETGFRRYFEQFGGIVDVVVMYDHNTQRPRGFGFVTFDSEEAVERVLVKPFHQLNGKTVEVKRAIPKDPSAGPIRTPLGSYNDNICQANALPNGYSRMLFPVGVGPRTENGFSGFGSGYGFGPNLEGGGLSSPHVTRTGSSSPYGNLSRFTSPVGYCNGESPPSFSRPGLWGTGRLSYGSLFGSSSSFTGSGNVGVRSADDTRIGWDLENPSDNNENLGYISGNDSFSPEVLAAAAARNTKNCMRPRTLSYAAYNGIRDGSDISLYGNPVPLRSTDSEWNGGGPLSLAFGLDKVTLDAPVSKRSPGFIGDCSAARRGSSRGCAQE